MNDASTADTKTVSTPYTTFLQGLGREPSADECWRWAAEHVGTAEEPRALSDAGWYTARDGRHEAALTLFRRVVEFGGEFARDAQVGIVDQLYALDRASEADQAQHALRAELDTQPAGFTDLRVFDDMVEVLCEHEQHELALAWCQAGLDRIAETNDTPDGETDEYRHGLLIDRGFLRGELGIPLDEDDLAAETEADAALTAFRALVHDKWDDPFHSQDGETYDGIVLRWAREDFTAVRERWPESTVHYGDDYATYTARIQREARGYDESGAAHVHMVTATLADFEAYAQRTGQDPADHTTRQHYGEWHHTTHPDQTLTWPPARNGPCWCESGRKYKKCCGTPANN
ncbi:SEC-C metal-binding domain-containing protein [Streptomyces sp. NPDC051664]|uniref:SEC-C metal-binding domain-containing protein n=1 Tax=Streptomyces sp. NPDC051664 TaxID=3365668 RepID=UPI0037AEF7B5